VALSHSPSIITNGLVLCLDAGNTKSYPGSGTTWTDLSGRGNNGTMSNITFNSLNGGSMVFNGTSSSVSNTLANPGSTPILFDFWINSDSSSPVGIFDTASNQSNVLRNYSAGNVEWWLSDPSVSLGITSGVWTNITVQYSFSTNRTITYYRNGSLISTTTGSTTSTYAWSSLVFGNINGGTAGWYSGKIAKIKIYNRALTAAEVSQNFNALRGRFGI